MSHETHVPCADSEKVVMPRLIVCSACYFPGGTVLLGVRHWDEHMHKHRKDVGLRAGTEEQGFLDNWGKFLTRDEAWKVAEAAGQIRRVTSSAGPGELYSEDLW